MNNLDIDGESCEYFRENGEVRRLFRVKSDIGSLDLKFGDTVDLVVVVEVVDDFLVDVEGFSESFDIFLDPKGNTGIVHSVVVTLLLESCVVVTSSSSSS